MKKKDKRTKNLKYKITFTAGSQGGIEVSAATWQLLERLKAESDS